MSWRYPLIYGLRVMGRVLEEAVIGIAAPDDLIRLGRRYFTALAERWRELEWTELYQPEEEFIGASGLTKGRVLVVGCGGGRDAIALARRGFTVTAIDQVPALVEIARANAARAGVSADLQCAEISRASWPPQTFDLALLPNLMYTYIPTRRRRVQTLGDLRNATKPGGWCYLNFICTNSDTPARQWFHGMQRFVSWATWGNRECELGDTLEHGLFEHKFYNFQSVEHEAQAAGWAVRHLGVPSPGVGCAWLTAPSGSALK